MVYQGRSGTAGRTGTPVDAVMISRGLRGPQYGNAAVDAKQITHVVGTGRREKFVLKPGQAKATEEQSSGYWRWRLSQGRIPAETKTNLDTDEHG
jgi:hypothetical protein